MFCNRCGAENPGDAAYCSNCGAGVGTRSVTAPTPPAPPPGSTPVPLPPPAGLPDTITYTAAPSARPVGGLTTALTVLFPIAALLALIGIGTRIQLLATLDDIRLDDPIRALDDIDDAYTIAEGAQAIAMLVALAILVLLIIWTWRVRANVDTWGASNARLPTGMAIGAWFIPVFWYLGPYWSMSDAYKAADPQLVPGTDLRTRPRCRTALAWWIVWSLGNAVLWLGEVATIDAAGTFGPDESAVAFELAVNADSARAATAFTMGGEILMVAAAVLGLVAIRRMGTRHQERLALGAASG